MCKCMLFCIFLGTRIANTGPSTLFMSHCRNKVIATKDFFRWIVCFKRACRWKLYVLCNCKWTEHPWYYSVRLRHHAPSTLWSQSFIFVRFTCNFRRLVTSDLLNSRTNCCRLCFEITSRWLHTYHLWIQLKPPKVYETSSSMQTPFTLQSYCVTHCTFTRDFRSYCKATKLPFFEVETFRDQCVEDLQKLFTRCLLGGYQEKVRVCAEAADTSTTFDDVVLNNRARRPTKRKRQHQS